MKTIRFLLVVILLLVTAGIATAEYMTLADVRYDAREYPDGVYEQGGSQGNSGAYIQILAGIVGYDELTRIDISAKHADTGFKVGLVEMDKSCVGEWPYPSEAEQWFTVRLKPDESWMRGAWNITLKFKTATGAGKETITVNVPGFNYPPVPSGVEFSVDNDHHWVSWDSLGEPGGGNNSHVEYRLVTLTEAPAACATKSYALRTGGRYYEMWDDRIATQLPFDWTTGRLVRIENRDYEYVDGRKRFDRAVRYFYIP